MLKIVTANGKDEVELFNKMRSRALETGEKVEAAVSEIVSGVRARGFAAVSEYTLRFDGVSITPENAEIPMEAAKAAWEGLRPDMRHALDIAAERIYNFNRNNLPKSVIYTEENGMITGERVRALDTVGIYVPGGTAAYPSSVLMNALPARAAGVREIVMVTPPGKDGVNPVILAAAYRAGVNRIFTVGGAQAVAALAYGAAPIPRVDKITGPGNMYVAAAKRQVYGVVDIDMIAGPSEILIIADEGANPAHAAADMLSQAEHDVNASAILLCLSQDFANAAASALSQQLVQLPRRGIAQLSVDNYGAAVVCDSLDSSVALANSIAPEHLEIMTAQPFELLPKIDNAGSVFLGYNTPEALGDYMAGPNHVLPTGGTARFFSPLSAMDFMKKSGYIYASSAALSEFSKDIVKLAQSEGLSAHARSVSIRC